MGPRPFRLQTKPSSPQDPKPPWREKRENRLSKRACVRFAGLFSYYIMMIIFIAASRDIFPMSPPSAQMAYNAPQTQRVHSKKHTPNMAILITKFKD